MSGGRNGMSPIQNLSDRQKCPEHPTKRKYPNGDLARAEAKRRSKEAGMEIAAYLCSGCGQYHLTKNVDGDSITLRNGKFSAGEFRDLAPNHPVFADIPEPEADPIPGDFETRVRFAREYLAVNPEPTSAEMCEAFGGCTKDSLRKVMMHLGYRNTRGRTARWVPDIPAGELGNEVEEPIDVPVIDRETDEPVPDVPARLRDDFEPPAREVPDEMWIDLDANRIHHMAVGDLIAAYAAAGLSIRIQVGSHA